MSGDIDFSGAGALVMVHRLARVTAVFMAAAMWGFSSPAHAQPDYPVSQGWNQSHMRAWYELSQGSRLMKWNWLQALRNPDGTVFFTKSAMEKLGYNYFAGEDERPIGFVLDHSNDQTWLGLNCAACHTAKLTAQEKEVWVHGGQTMADIQGFTTQLIAAVSHLKTNEQAFDTFSNAVLGEVKNQTSLDALKKELNAWLDFRTLINNTGNDSHWGRGRSDAVGIILATTAAVLADPTIPEDQREPLPASNAPVSYPFVWNTNQQARLQHNGVVDNGVNLGPVKVAKIGALIRNWTEALGVFADVKVDAKGEKITTSIRLDNLLRIEQALAHLQSPQWPQEFGTLDQEKRKRGAAHYQTYCASCHGLADPQDTTTVFPLLEKPRAATDQARDGFVYLQPLFDEKTLPQHFEDKVTLSDQFIGTDPSMACNALLHVSPSGKFQGKRNVRGFVPSLGDAKFAERAVTTDLLRVLIQRDIIANKTTSLRTIAENQLVAAGEKLIRMAFSDEEDDYVGQSADEDPLSPLKLQLQACVNKISLVRTVFPDMPFPVYKARPLNGIWATAPYLHNGSVPTLADLLLPQSQRPSKFGYFAGEMDLEKSGLKDQSSNPEAFIFRSYDDEGKVIIGNWNGGHEYGVDLNQEQRMELVEYLKGL